MKYLIILTLSIIQFNIIFAQEAFLEQVESIDVNLSHQDFYSKSDVNDTHLIFYNLTQKELSIYEFKSKKLISVTLVKGRGPGEITDIADLFLYKNHIYLVDGNAFQFLKLDLRGNNVTSIFNETNSFVDTTIKNDSTVFLYTVTDLVLGSFYHKIDLTKSTLKTTPIHKEIVDNDKINYRNAYAFEGRADVNDNHIVHVHKYQSKITIYPLDEDTKKYSFLYDQSIPIEESRYVTKDGQTAMSFPPSKLYILLNEIFIHPKEEKVYINAYGKTENMKYEYDKFVEYDFVNRKFTSSFELGYKPASTARYKDLLYVIPELENESDNNKIRVYKIK